ncbi:MAG TPA: acyl-CoA dehydrogenase family protein [Candidatus Binatia bacterium]|nr:acyl-CoA dehydrogenase family protein [Candidatus Binatia bacterium]
MGYRLSEDEAMLQRTVRELGERELAPLVAQAERTGVFPRARVLPRMAELGLFSIGVPATLGGVGGTSLMLCLVAEEVARVCGGFAIAVMPSVLAPAAVVRMGGSGGPALRALMTGEILAAMAFTEPGAGSDLMNLQTTVTRTANGLVLNGAKTFISNGPTADVYVVAAIRAEFLERPRAERGPGFGVYVVPRGAPGLMVGRPIAKLGMRSSETGELAFENVAVAGTASDAARSPGGGGFRGMMALLDFNRLYIAALSIGIAEAAFEASLRWVKERVAFDRPIGHHQATGFKVARMAVDLDAARALVQRACELYDAGARCTREISAAKLFATEAAVRITNDAVQIHGGYGYVDELPVERYLRDARVGTIWEGTSEIQQQIICRELGLYES